MNLNKQVAVITGGASGMGLACAKMLIARGIRVAVWDREPCPLDCFSVPCDVRSASLVEAALEKTLQVLDVPSICVNCAGVAPAKRIVGKSGAMPLEDFTDVIEINLIGTFNVMRVIAAAMIGRGEVAEEERGVFINTASIAAYDGQIGQSAYSASKGGIVSLTLPAARELAAHGIRVNTIAPGLIATPLLLGMSEEIQHNLREEVPFPRRFGFPDEFASLVMHVIENAYINGEVIRLDGALRMQPR